MLAIVCNHPLSVRTMVTRNIVHVLQWVSFTVALGPPMTNIRRELWQQRDFCAPIGQLKQRLRNKEQH